MQLTRNSADIIAQILLAIAYVVVMRLLLSLGFMLWGEGASSIEHITRMLLAVTVDLVIVFSLNFAVVRAHFSRLGLFIGVGIFGYYYIYNPIGHHLLMVYISIMRSPPHLFNMLLSLFGPLMIGKIIDKRLSLKNANVIA